MQRVRLAALRAARDVFRSPAPHRCIAGRKEILVQVANRFQLGEDVRRAIVDAKREWSTGNARRYLQPHQGYELANVVRSGPGSRLWECRVGQAHPGDANPAGRRRLVLWEDSGQIKRIFFTEDHYRPGSWYEITG